MDLNIDFENKTIYGKVDLTFEVLKENVSQVLILDTNSLDLKGITDEHGNSLKYRVEEIKDSVIGDPLYITLDKLHKKGADFTITIKYSTTPASPSIQWLTPEMTFGKKHPFMFTQNEPIYSRSLVPCQDTPANKVKIKASLTVRSDLVAMFGGVLDSYIDEGKTITYKYIQSIPIPTYLIAFAAGNILRKKVADKIYVLTEPEKLEAVYEEFSESSSYFKKAQEYLFEYEWGDYNILVLPPAFPYGGMENPNLTFATPSLIAGDKSLVNVIAHELAHSWTGNLVTNSSWDNFWLNEGFTVFFERKLIQLVFDNDTRKLHSQIGYADLLRDISTYPKGSTYTSLFPRVGKNNPDDAFSTVPYEKGYNFLYYIETILGETAFRDLFITYIRKYARNSVETSDFKKTFEEFVNERYTKEDASSIFKKIDWETWINAPGEPPIKNDFGKFNFLTLI
jgi:leukotriene-A4 hydrolase